MVETIFIEIGIVMAVAFLMALIMKIIKQPTILGYALAGILVGPAVFGIINPAGSLQEISQIGIAFLLFSVGLSINPKTAKSMGKTPAIAAIIQIIATFFISLSLCVLLKFSVSSSIILALCASISSSIVTTKIFADKGETESLNAKMSVIILMLQNALAIGAIVIISLGNHKTFDTAKEAVIAVFLLTALLFMLSKYALPYLMKYIAKSQEVLLIFSIAWLGGVSILSIYAFGSIEIGALAAGICLSFSAYKYEISSKIKPISEASLIIFFAYLGSMISPAEVLQNLPIITALCLTALIVKPLAVMVYLGWMGYTKRSGFLSGVSISQVGEFSLKISALAVVSGLVQPNVVLIISVVSLVTISISSSITSHSGRIYSKISGFLSLFERKGRKIDEGVYHEQGNYEIILFGHNRIGFTLLDSFKRMKKRFLVVDYDPEMIKYLVEKGIDCRYGDASNLELLSSLPIKKTKMIISTIPDFEANKLLIETAKKTKSDSIIVVISHHIDDALKLYESGASYVIIPHFISGAYISSILEYSGFDKEKIMYERIKSIQELKERKKEGQRAPTHEKG